jgi:Helix-turn-helix of DDE superfamily endonuclease
VLAVSAAAVQGRLLARSAAVDTAVTGCLGVSAVWGAAVRLSGVRPVGCSPRRPSQAAAAGVRRGRASGMRPPTWVRAALSLPCFTGISQQHLGDLIAELGDPWTAQHQAALGRRRGHARHRAAGAGPHHRLALCDRVLVTLVVLRLQLPHQALATLFGVDRVTITRAVGEVRPLLAARGFAVPGQPGVRLRTLADVFAYAQASGVELRLDGTETQVRRPRAHRVGRRAFVSGKRKQTPASPPSAAALVGMGRRTSWNRSVPGIPAGGRTRVPLAGMPPTGVG